MKTHEILRRAIPDGEAVETVAQRMSVSVDTVRRWRREPESDDAPLSTGRANPLDRAEELIDAVFLVNPSGAHTVANHPRDHYAALAETHALKGTVKGAAALALRDTVKAVNAINLDAPVGEIEAKLAAAEEKFNEVKRHVRVTYAEKNGDRLSVYKPINHERNLG
jgi:hypothetical protein